MFLKVCSHLSSAAGGGGGCYQNTHFAPHADLPSFRHELTLKKNMYIHQQQRLLLQFSHSKYGISRGATASSSNIEPDASSSSSSNIEPDASSSSSSSSSNKSPLSSWKKWLIGALFSVVLPAAGHKGGVFVALKAKIDQTVATVDTVTDIVEDIAEQADKLVDEVESKVPENSNFRKTVETLDDLTDIALEQARKAEDLVEQVKEAKDQLFEVIPGLDKDDGTKKKKN